MYRSHAGYLASTRHPWPCLLFLVPLLVAYEAGVLWLGGARSEVLRNGADAWLRWGLEAFGLHQLYWAPVFIVVLFLGWSWMRRRDKPRQIVAVCRGMVMESLSFAGGLFVLSRTVAPLWINVATHLSVPPLILSSPPLVGAEDRVREAGGMGQMVTFVGAGIYEEVLFRLLLFATLNGLLRLAGSSRFLAALLTTLISALLFAAAHHIGPYGEAFDRSVFLFRALAGLYFGLLYQLRGFGIAVGTHASYDVLVGVLMV
jgi:hypothetical protein